MAVSLGAGAAAGALMAAVNLALHRASWAAHPEFSPRWALMALQPAINEEVAMRLAPVALAVYLAGGWPRSRAQAAVIWAVGIVPHSAVHVLGQAGAGQVSEAAQFVLVTSLLFGLPLLALQRRSGLVAASGAHWLIDALRYVVTGGS